MDVLSGISGWLDLLSGVGSGGLDSDSAPCIVPVIGGCGIVVAAKVYIGHSGCCASSTPICYATWSVADGSSTCNNLIGGRNRGRRDIGIPHRGTV